MAWGNDSRPARLKGEYSRDEDEQARNIGELLDVFEAEDVDNVFVNTFARYDLPHRDRPHENFDMASFGMVKVLEDLPRRELPRHAVGTQGRVPHTPWRSAQ